VREYALARRRDHRGISERHGGLVTAASGGLGQGSEFTISLPMQAE
jgi:signal transduction histidine kinase